MMIDSSVGGMKEARILLPHRSNSVIQDWIEKGVVEASNAKGTGHPRNFTFPQLVDLVVVDKFSAWGLLSKPYVGKNYTGDSTGEGNIMEVFDYPSGEDRDKIFPPVRSRKHAIEFYKVFDFNVLITIALMRKPPPLGEDLEPIELARTERRREKVGQIYYNVTYLVDEPDKEKDLHDKDRFPGLRDLVNLWRRGTDPSKRESLCLISVDQLATRVEQELGVSRNNY